VQTGGACGDDSDVWAFEAKFDRHMTRNHVDDRCRYKKRGDTAGATVDIFNVGVLNGRQAANTGADVAANACGFFFAQRVARGQAGVSHCLASGGHAQMNETAHVARFFLRDVIFNVETFDLTREMGGERVRIKMGDVANARLTRQQGSPRRFYGVAYGANTT